MQTQIRPLLKKYSDHGIHSLPFYCHILDTNCFHFRIITVYPNSSVPSFSDFTVTMIVLSAQYTDKTQIHVHVSISVCFVRTEESHSQPEYVINLHSFAIIIFTIWTSTGNSS